MGQRQNHRGKHPEDVRLFAPSWIPKLQEAVYDLSYLLTRGYAIPSALKLVGDRFQLASRQRIAVERAACSDASLMYRKQHEVALLDMAGQALCIDGYNLLITVESVLSGGFLLQGRDRCLRDMASIHGSYHRVTETILAIRLLGDLFKKMGVAEVHWYFDAPVSNSGKLKAVLTDEANQANWPWTVELDANPDRVLAVSSDIIISSDSWILDRAKRWGNVMDAVIQLPEVTPCIIDIGIDTVNPRENSV